MSPPTVDVIIPTRNRAKLTIEAVASVRAQTFEDWRVILVDDASDDGSGEALAEAYRNDPRIVLVRRRHRGWEQAARQSGLEVSRSPFVCVLDSDDLWLPGKLEAQLRCFERERHGLPGLGAVSCWTRWVEANGETWRETRPSLHGTPGPLAVGNMSSLLISREALDRAGGLLPPDVRSLPSSANIEFYVRLAAVCQFSVVPRFLVICRRHLATQVSGRAFGTLQAAMDLEYVLSLHAETLARCPVDRARLRAKLAARFLEAGETRRGLGHLRSALDPGRPRLVLEVLGRYGPYALRRMARNLFAGASRAPDAPSPSADGTARPPAPER